MARLNSNRVLNSVRVIGNLLHPKTNIIDISVNARNKSDYQNTGYAQCQTCFVVAIGFETFNCSGFTFLDKHGFDYQ